MKNKYIIKGVIKNEFVYFVNTHDEIIWNSNFEVKQYSSTIDGATQFSSYDDAMNTIRQFELHGFDAFSVCPICGNDYSRLPAISRKDNKTEICPNCGIGEAFLDFCDNYKKTT